jgi:hypothetical protein
MSATTPTTVPRLLDAELFVSGRGERVEPCPPVVGRDLPLGRHPSLDEHPLQRGIERSFFDREHVRGDHLNVLRDPVAVHRLDGQRLQDQHLERAGEQFVLALGRFHEDHLGIDRLWKQAQVFPKR